jgi:hypothetical protein
MGKWRRRSRQLLDDLKRRHYSGNLRRKQQIDFSCELDLEETMGQPVVAQTTDIMYLILYEYIVCKGALPRIEIHKLRFHFTLILSGLCNDRGDKNEE